MVKDLQERRVPDWECRKGHHRTVAFCTLALLLVLGPFCSAQQRTFTLDSAHSTIEYTVAGNFHTVHGTFQFKSGTIAFDPATGAASGRLVVDPLTGESGSEARDNRMKRAILETEKYPEVSLTIESIEGQISSEGGSEIKLHGAMLLHGQSHPMVIPVQLDVTGNALHATAEIVIPYVAWGLKNPSTLFLRVSDKVTMEINVLGRLSP